jgi:hypothetical protein
MNAAWVITYFFIFFASLALGFWQENPIAGLWFFLAANAYLWSKEAQP